MRRRQEKEQREWLREKTRLANRGDAEAADDPHYLQWHALQHELQRVGEAGFV